jgi:ribonucleotide monophosphatase NagD (HAD superfamily)
MMTVAMQRMGLPAERCMMIGDRLETDIRMGQHANFATAVTLTGVTKREDIAQMSPPPDYIIENLSELPGLVN